MAHLIFRRFRGWMAAGLGLGLALFILAGLAVAQGSEASQVETLQKKIAALSGEGRHAEAIPLALQVVEIRKKARGENSPAYADALAALAGLYSETGDSGQAEALFKRVLAIREKALGPDHLDVGTSLNDLGILYYNQGRYEEAEPIFKRYLALREKTLGRDHPDVSPPLSNLASVYQAQGRYDEAEPLFKRSLAIMEKKWGPESPEIRGDIVALGVFYYQQGRYAEAEPYFRRNLAIAEKARGAEDPETGTAATNLGTLYIVQGRYADAEPLLKRSLAIFERARGPEDPETRRAVTALGALYLEQGRHAEAEPLLKRSLAIAEKTGGPEAAEAGVALNNLARLYIAQGRYPEAEPLLKRNLAIQEKAFGPDHPEVALGLDGLAQVYDYTGRYTEAEPLYKRALAIREKSLGPEHPDVAKSLNNLAVLYDEQGRYGEAEPLYRRSLAVNEKVFGPDHPEVATVLQGLGVLLYEEGKFGEAEPLFRRALAIREKAYGPNHRDVASTLNQLAQLYEAQARYAEAKASYERSLAVWEKSLGPDHPDLAVVLTGLAVLDRELGRDAEAETLNKRSLAILEKSLGADHPTVAAVLNNLGELYAGLGRYAEAESCHRRSLAIREKALGPDHPEVAASLNNLAKAALMQDRAAEAAPLFERSLSILEKSVGSNGPNVPEALSNLAVLFYRLGRSDRASDYFDRCLAGRLRELEYNYQFMTEKERLDFLRSVRRDFNGYFSFVLSAAGRRPELAGKMYDVVLWKKGFVAQSVAALRAKILAGGDPEALARLDLLSEKKGQLAKLVSSPPPSDPRQQEARRSRIEVLEREANDLERELVARSSALGEERRLARASWREVRDALKPGETAVEIVRFPFYDGRKWTGQNVYAALVLRRKSRRPELIDLGRGTDLERIPLADYRRLTAEPGLDQRPDAGRRFYDAFWKPIERRLGKAKRVYLSADGELNQVALGVVGGRNGRPLAETFDLRMLNSTKDLLRRDPASAARTAVLFGDPDYDLAEPAARAALASDTAGAGTSAAAKDARLRGQAGLRSAGLRGEDAVEELPGTEREIEDVAKTFEQEGWRVLVYGGPGALEERVKEVRRPRVLHLATHGFFEPDQALGTGPAGRPAGDKSAAVVEDPMLRSGLFLAGVNRVLKGAAPPSDLDDGILTAYEASQLDLEGTELVVLSACETGLGRVESGEGVFGLRRAFQVAGAGAVLMSMWSVPDTETRELMSLFYEKWLGGRDKHRALREAQLEMRRRVRDRYGRDLPFYWGAFVLVGR